MALTVAAVLAGAVAGRVLLRRPLRYRHLGPPRLRWAALLAAGILLAVAADRIEGDAAVWVAVAGQVLLLAGVVLNGQFVGSGVLAAGLVMNLVPMVVDRGVPVRPAALVEAGVLEGDEIAGATVRGPRHLEDDGDWFGWLGDAVPLEPLRTVVSIGDLVVAVGVADVVAHAARPRRRRRAVGQLAADDDDRIVIDLRGYVRSDEELEAMLRHPTAHVQRSPALS